MQVTSITGAIKPEDIIIGVKKEVYVTALRAEAEQTIDLLQQEATPVTQKVTEKKKTSIRKEMEKTIEGIIHAKDIDPILNVDTNIILRNNGQESDYLSGGILINISDKQIKNAVETHIEEIKQQKEIKLQEILNPIPRENTETGSMPSSTIINPPVSKMPLPETRPLFITPIEPKVIPFPVQPLPKPSVSGEVLIAPKPSVSGEITR